MKKILSLAAAGMAVFFAATLVLAPVASAAEFLAPADKDGNTTLSSTETHRNAYVVGRSVFANSPITGDLYAAGGSLTVEGTVEQDLVVAGGNVTINGNVGGDVRVAGGTVIINSTIGGDLVVAGGTVTLTEKGSVEGDVAAAGGEVILDGAMGMNVKVRAGQVTINNKVNGNVDVIADQSLTFGSKAQVANNILYKGVKDAVVLDGAQVSTIDFQPLAERERGAGRAGEMMAGLITIAFFVKIVGIFLFGLLMVKLYPRTTNTLVQNLPKNPWWNLLVGFIGLIIMPIIFVVLLITVVGMYIAFFVLLIWLMLIILTSILACIYTGAWILQKINKQSEMVVNWHAVAVGSVVLTVVSIVPVVGVLLFVALMLMSFGATLRFMNDTIKEEQAFVPTTPTDAGTPSNPTIA